MGRKGWGILTQSRQERGGAKGETEEFNHGLRAGVAHTDFTDWRRQEDGGRKMGFAVEERRAWRGSIIRLANLRLCTENVTILGPVLFKLRTDPLSLSTLFQCGFK